MSSGYGYIGPYRLLNCVNTGQTSRLWQAYDDTAREYVAIKTLLDNLRRDRQQIQFLKWEYTVAAKLAHRTLIAIRRYGRDRGTHYLLMEWFTGLNLKQRINRGIDSYASLLPQIIAGASEAVSFFNAQGWIHRDIKPDNFLVDDEGNVKLIDFALARREPRGIGKLFGGRHAPQGTASYMSPEQILGKPIDSRSDVYSLGCTLFELLGGRPPFTGVNVSDLLQKHLRSAAPPVTVLNPNVTPELASLIHSALAKNPNKRPESSTEFHQLLRNTRPLRLMPKQASS